MGTGTGAGPERFDETRQFQLLVGAVTDYAIYMIDPEGIVVTWNPGAERIKGYAAAEIIGTHFSIFYTPDDRTAGMPERELQRAAAEGRHESEGWRIRKDGTRFWTHTVLDAIRSETGELIGFAEVTRDVSRLMATQEALRESERRFRLLVDGVTDYAIFMLDSGGHITKWNTGAERIKGFAEHEVIGKHFSIFYTPEDRAAGEPERALQHAATEGRNESEGWRIRKDGTRFWANAVLDAIRDDSGNLVGFAKVTRDVTRQREAQESLERTRAALFQAQKMEVIGQLTGGVAHDFNNMLTVISNNLDLLTRNPQGPRERRLIDIAQRAAERCSKLTEQLLAFARRQPLRPEPHDANHLIGSFEAVLRRACGEAVEIAIDFDPELRPFSVDAQQFESTLLNLALNSRDAMPSGGTLRIATRNVDIDSSAAARLPDVQPGAYVMITVADTGEGMAPEIAARAIEPFFTTKDVGKGSGLGLSQVYGFVAQSGGFVDIASEVGIGTTVRIYLPASPKGARRPDKESAKGSEALTVLAVEDDPDVLEATVETLESLGYHVLTANDGMSALTSLQRDVHIDILFTDVVMPKGMNGVQLAREARRLRPDLRILLASGYPMGALSANHGLNGEFAFLAKPYRWPDLEEKLRNLGAPR